MFGKHLSTSPSSIRNAMENNSKAEVCGIGTCKLKLKGWCNLLLHDILDPNIQWNSVFVIVLLDFGFRFSFYGSRLTIYYVNVYYGCGFMSNHSKILDMDVECFNVVVFSLIASSCNSNINDTTSHSHLGYIGQDRITRLAKDDLLG